MAERPPPGPTAAAQVEASLHALAQVLRQEPPLEAEAQRALAARLAELGNVLAAPAPPPAEVAHLADGIAAFARAAHPRRPDPAHAASARERLEAALLSAEASAPVLTGAVRRFLDALANIGI